MSDQTSTPKSRLEQYLQNCVDACGCEGLPTPRTRAEAYLYALNEKLAEGGGGGGGNVSTPDYLQNDPAASDYIKNRPFYESTSVLLPETEIPFTDNEFVQQGYTGEEFTVGETYIVSWNGTEYTCIAQDVPDFGGTAVGNVGLAMGGTDTGEPFVIGTSASQGVFMAAALDGSTSATVKITGGTIKKIDKKYLPAATGIMYLDVEYVADEAEGTTTIDYDTFLEMRDHMLNNGMVIMRIRENNTETWCYPSGLITDPDVLALYNGAVFVAIFWSISDSKRTMLAATQDTCGVSFFGFN